MIGADLSKMAKRATFKSTGLALFVVKK